MTGPSRVVVMGVAGSGKSTVARLLAQRLGARFLEGDEFHPASNLAKMAAGRPLTDDDWWPWLAALRQAMRAEHDVMVACSALERRHRDALRRAEHVRFVHLVVSPEEAVRRVAARHGQAMGQSMVAGQLAMLEVPAPDETDAAPVDADRDLSSVVGDAGSSLEGLRPGTAVTPLATVGGPEVSISDGELRSFVERLAETAVIGSGARRVLLVPPDITRRQSRAGEVTGLLYERLASRGCEVGVLPALGTHGAVTPAQAALLFGDGVPFESILEHRWRVSPTCLGEVPGAEVSALSAGRMADPVSVEVGEELLRGWDLVVSVGQVVPHEVTGMANFTKNLVVGVGGAATINGTHLLSALCGIEHIMGRVHTPVRDVVDAAFDRFLAPQVPVLWILTVVEATSTGVVLRGLFAGTGTSGESGGAAYAAAASLSARCNIEIVPEPLERLSCWMDSAEFRTTWLANKAVYRTRMALADDAELIVLAPGVGRFGEDPVVDSLIRRHGYRGTAATLDAIDHDPELAANRGAAAHLVHGSSEGRFRIVYCTDPASGGLSQGEVEAVGYQWRSLPEELARSQVSADTGDGAYRDRNGRPFHHLARPALGLWSTAGRLSE